MGSRGSRREPWRVALWALGITVVAGAASPAAPPEVAPDLATLRAAMSAIEASPRGPFEAIRWFCADGSVQLPRPGACSERGGGVQHGVWSEPTRRLRAAGFRLANVLADLPSEPLLGPQGDPDLLVWILIERFLVGFDDGWILRGARGYRGAFQAEDEAAGAKRLLDALLSDPAWLEPPRHLLLREAVRSLAAGEDGDLAARVREQASGLAEQAPRFQPIRNKIHSLPDPSDAVRVREACPALAAGAQRERCAKLAADIEALYRGERIEARLARLAGAARAGALVAPLRAAQAAAREPEPEARLTAASGAMRALREVLPELDAPAPRRRALEASLALEEVVFRSANELLAARAGTSRAQRLGWLERLAEAGVASGWLSSRQGEAARDVFARFRTGAAPTLSRWRRELRYLERVPGWAQRNLEFHFGEVVAKLALLEPRAPLFVQDRLRGSPLLAFATAVDELALDAALLAGVRHTLFGRSVGTGLRALNPGLGRGTLQLPAPSAIAGLARDSVAVLPETTADLPPVAAILTRGEGSSLSHVQLLARNLGIPNLVVAEPLLPALAERAGQRVVVAVSPGGVVEISQDGPGFATVFGSESPSEGLRIRPDLAKLDLADATLRDLRALRAADSGRIAGPKAANLAELARLFPDAVARGVVIPFGAFRRLLERPLEPGGPAVFDWMRERYAELAALEPQPERHELALRSFLERLRGWIVAQDPGPAFRAELRAALAASFGPEATPGLFVRSDTNVEDLPGFTGAGLNLTLPNVVGFENLVAAIGRVWASPFTERAFAWRQSLMDQPQWVFPAVLLLESVPVEKSGVMVTAEVETGDPAWLSIATSEGVGGAVEGQAAEELRVRRGTGALRLLSQATAPRRAALDPVGGLRLERASGRAVLLERAEIERLLRLAAELPERFARLRDDEGRAVPADVEFGFRDGRLALFQIRPFVESKRARRTEYLRALDAGTQRAARLAVDLGAPPRAAHPPDPRGAALAPDPRGAALAPDPRGAALAPEPPGAAP